jgi:gamma-glutamyl:cysteine ligase YbdK (ATP-grasp superfamily)
MSHCFEPLTVGYDWEMAVLTDTGENVKEKDVERISDEIRMRLPWADPGTDLELVESRIGSVRTFAELLEKSTRFDKELQHQIAKNNWMLLRAGARPFEREPIGAHIHVGTVKSWRAAMRVQNGMLPYVAPLAALMANSPIYRRRWGEYKSYRVASFAEWCSMPQPLVAPAFAQPGWASDVCVKLAWGSTVELRVGDGVSSTRLMCELVALVAGMMYHVAEHEPEREFSEDEYRSLMINRWRAAKYGLQAVLTWNGEEVPVQTLLTWMVDMAQDGLRLLDISKADLRIVRTMIRKRQTQADFQLAVFAKENGDAHRYTRTLANIQRDPRAFEKYLRKAPELGIVEPSDHADEILARIEVETPYSLLLRSTPLSPAQLDTSLDGFVAAGRVTERRDNLGVRVFTRSDLK